MYMFFSFGCDSNNKNFCYSLVKVVINFILT
nr:MAG TPA: hypothetical protein [Caudoviricetes sp.]